MRKRRRDLMTVVGAVVCLLAPTADADFFDGFDSYNTTTPLPDQSTWEAWDDDPAFGDFYALSYPARSQPRSCAIDADDDAVHQFSGYTDGVWVMAAWQYIPASASGGATYFILLNEYVPDGSSATNNWSTQLQCNPDTMLIESEPDGVTLPLVTGRWAEIRVVIDLGADQQSVFYNDELLITKSWTDGYSGGGSLEIAAVDLWANGTTYEAYYDDMSLSRRRSLDNPAEDPYAATTEPVEPWHELWPDYCTPREVTEWADNGNGVLDPDDYLGISTPASAIEWWRVLRVTFTITLDFGEPLPPDEQIFFDWQGPPIEHAPDFPLGPWQEVYPNYSTPWTCVNWFDNGDGLVGFDDWMLFEGPGGDIIELHVAQRATDIDIMRQEPRPPRQYLDGEAFNPYEAVEDPTGPWHEIWPRYCMPRNGTGWVDNGDGILSVCDYLQLEDNTSEAQWHHVLYVTFTMLLDEGDPVPPEEQWYFDWVGPPLAEWPDFPLGPWKEVHPVLGRAWECVFWEDTDGSGQVDFCDWLSFIGPNGETVDRHVASIATDLEVVAELPPCFADVNDDGVVDVLDLLAILAAWGTTGGGPEDVNGDGIVDVLDLLAVLGAWGPCP